jgi:tetratricopeptide (TPR) repeat protein
MRARIVFAMSVFGLMAVAVPAQAQVVVSIGNSVAHACFLAAKAVNFTTHRTDLMGGVAICDQALQLEPLTTVDRAATYDNRGVINDVMDHTDEAIADFNRSIALAELGDAYVNRGSALIKKKQYDKALADINKGMGLGMSYPYIGYYDRAVAEELMGQYRDAYYDYKHVVELEPNFAAAGERLKDFTVIQTPASASVPAKIAPEQSSP